MSNLSMQYQSPQDRQRLMGQLYLLLGKQVKSYHKRRHMGENSSVPVELARELMASMEYTIQLAGGLAPGQSAEAALQLGQKQLEAKMEKAQSLLELVTATAPGWQTECRWEALRCLRRYLAGFDLEHLAHKEPEELFYPILIPMPEGVRGIDRCLFYLNVLWQENQIMSGYDDSLLEQLWSRLPTDTLNQCEHVVLNGIGKAILSDCGNSLVFSAAEREKLRAAFLEQRPEKLVQDAALSLCRQLKLPDNASAYLSEAAAQLLPRLEVAVRYDHLAAVFL